MNVWETEEWLKIDNLKDEIWKDLYFVENRNVWDYRGIYQVSNMGRVKSLGNDRAKKEKILKQYSQYQKYDNKKRFKVDLYLNKKKKKWRVHQLVAHMFCNGYKDGLEVDHINSNPLDNRYDNLRWVTRKENNRNPRTLEKRLKNKSVLGINVITGEFRYAESVPRLCKKYHYNSAIIYCCCDIKIYSVSIKGKIYEYDFTSGVYDGFHWMWK